MGKTKKEISTPSLETESDPDKKYQGGFFVGIGFGFFLACFIPTTFVLWMHASANVYLGFGRVLALWDNAAGPSRNICVSWTGEDKIAHSGHYSRIADLVDDLTRTDEFVTSGTNFRLFTLEGELTRWADLHPAPPNGCSQVYFVPQGRQFQWPVWELGKVKRIPGLNSDGRPEVTLTAVSQYPPVFVAENLLQHSVVQKLKKEALDPGNPNRVQPSQTGWGTGGANSERTSQTSWDVNSDQWTTISEQLFKLLRIQFDEDLFDGLQIILYDKYQAYTAHFDPLPENSTKKFNWNPANGGSNRFVSVFLYMSSIPESAGGQLVFPNAENWVELEPRDASSLQLAKMRSEKLFSNRSWEYHLANECFDAKKLTIAPKVGRAVILYNYHAVNGTLFEYHGVHGACPVVADVEKWALTSWIWNAKRII